MADAKINKCVDIHHSGHEDYWRSLYFTIFMYVTLSKDVVIDVPQSAQELLPKHIIKRRFYFVGEGKCDA